MIWLSAPFNSLLAISAHLKSAFIQVSWTKHTFASPAKQEQRRSINMDIISRTMTLYA